MKYSFSALALLLLAPLAVVASSPPPFSDLVNSAQEQLTFDNVKESVRNVVNLDGDDDVCPDLKVRCVKEDGNDSKVVGDIGKQGFCRDGLKCKQCHSKKNALLCNSKYPLDCATKCKAVGSPI